MGLTSTAIRSARSTAEQRNRELQQVRQHDRHAIARGQAEPAAQAGREVGAEALDVGEAQRVIEIGECRLVQVTLASFDEHPRQGQAVVDRLGGDVVEVRLG